MSELTEMIKSNMEGMQEMYRAGYKAGVVEGRRQTMSEVLKDLNEIQKLKEIPHA